MRREAGDQGRSEGRRAAGAPKDQNGRPWVGIDEREKQEINGFNGAAWYRRWTADGGVLGVREVRRRWKQTRPSTQPKVWLAASKLGAG